MSEQNKQMVENFSAQCLDMESGGKRLRLVMSGFVFWEGVCTVEDHDKCKVVRNAIVREMSWELEEGETVEDAIDSIMDMTGHCKEEQGGGYLREVQIFFNDREDVKALYEKLKSEGVEVSGGYWL